MKRLCLLLILLVGCAFVVEYEAQVRNETDRVIYVRITAVGSKKTIFDGTLGAREYADIHLRSECYICVAIDVETGWIDSQGSCWDEKEIKKGLEEGKYPIIMFGSPKKLSHGTKVYNL